ncbi:MAG: dihydropteroate synthase [Chitinophagales bacterium]
MKSSLPFSSQCFDINGRSVTIEGPVVLGILNVTPDSFYADSRSMSIDKIVDKANGMIDEGAWALDIGGMSSRPGASIVSHEEEWSRISDVLSELQSSRERVLISLDTLHAATAAKALDKGWVDIINDISGGHYDDDMHKVVAEAKVPYILMDMPGTPKTMQVDLDDTIDVVSDVVGRLQQLIDQAHTAGIRDVIMDVGFGFGKTLSQNFTLLDSLDTIKERLDYPICVGVSRKSMITKTLSIDSTQALNGTTVLHTLALTKGATMLRCHDVRPAVEAIELMHSLKKK